jgi:hypothetical protein
MELEDKRFFGSLRVLCLSSVIDLGASFLSCLPAGHPLHFDACTSPPTAPLMRAPLPQLDL